MLGGREDMLPVGYRQDDRIKGQKDMYLTSMIPVIGFADERKICESRVFPFDVFGGCRTELLEALLGSTCAVVSSESLG